MPAEAPAWLKTALTGAAKRLTDSWDIHLHVALLHLRAHQHDRAVAELKEAAQFAAKRTVPDGVQALLLSHLAAAQSLRSRDDPAEALATMELAIKLDPQQPCLWQTLALVFILARSWEAAGVALSAQALRGVNTAGSADVLNNVGVVRLGQGQLVEAQRFFLAALHANRSHQEAANNYAVTLLHQGESSVAAQVLERVCEEAQDDGVPVHVHVWANMGCAWRSTGAVQRSREACLQALKLALWCEGVRFGVARQFIRDGNLKEAHAALSDLLRLRNAPHYHSALSSVLFARAELTLHAPSLPNVPPPNSRDAAAGTAGNGSQGSLLGSQAQSLSPSEEEGAKQLVAAGEALKQAETHSACAQLSVQALQAGDYSRAVQVLAAHPALQTAHASSAVVWCNLAAALQLNEQSELALQAYARALPLLEGKPAQAAVVYSNLGVLHRTARQWAEAETALNHAMRLAPHSATARVNLGVLYAAQALAPNAASTDADVCLTKASAAWHEAMRIDPTCVAAQHNLARLAAIAPASSLSSSTTRIPF